MEKLTNFLEKVKYGWIDLDGKIHEKDHKPMVHAFMIYKENNEYCWIEYAFRTMIGIRRYQTIKKCLEDVKSEFLLENKITDVGKIYFYSYEKPEYGINQQKFIEHCLKGMLIEQEYSNLEI